MNGFMCTAYYVIVVTTSFIIVIAFDDLISIRSVIAIIFAGSDYTRRIRIIIKTGSLVAYGCK